MTKLTSAYAHDLAVMIFSKKIKNHFEAVIFVFLKNVTKNSKYPIITVRIASHNKVLKHTKMVPKGKPHRGDTIGSLPKIILINLVRQIGMPNHVW